jgi:hypothetical protein
MQEAWDDIKSENTKFSLVTKIYAKGYSYFLGFICNGLYDFTVLNKLANNYLSALFDDGLNFINLLFRIFSINP